MDASRTKVVTDTLENLLRNSKDIFSVGDPYGNRDNIKKKGMEVLKKYGKVILHITDEMSEQELADAVVACEDAVTKMEKDLDEKYAHDKVSPDLHEAVGAVVRRIK